jgi:hypothetical protein
MIMAQFYGEIQGNRDEASRMGTKESGFTANIRGWDVGCRVVLRHYEGEDYVSIYLTSGSNGRVSDKLIGQFKASDFDRFIAYEALERM